MIAAVIVAAAMLAVWLYLCHLYRMPPDYTLDMDVCGQQWAFIYFLDRYTAILRYVGLLAAGAIVAAVLVHNRNGAYLLTAALIDDVMLQAFVLYSYENYAHRRYTKSGTVIAAPYSSRRYALVLTLAIGAFTYFAIGAFVLIGGF